MEGIVKNPLLVPGLILVTFAWLAVAFAPSVPLSGDFDYGVLGVFIGLWVIGMYAMMMPSLTPLLSLIAVDDGPGQLGMGSSRASKVLQFMLAYLGVWSFVGAITYVTLGRLAVLFPSLVGIEGPIGLGSAVVLTVAGAYQLGPLKQKALGKCRSPATFLITNSRTGRWGAFRMGLDYSIQCTECCWALMVILVLVGAMSLAWMALFASVIFVEKVLPHGEAFSKVIGVALVGLGIMSAAVSIGMF